jgi:hypothetical protein
MKTRIGERPFAGGSQDADIRNWAFEALEEAIARDRAMTHAQSCAENLKANRR